MNTIKRDLQAVLDSKIGKGKVILLIGPRQTGKTTLLKEMLSGVGERNGVQYWNCDEPDVRARLVSASSAQLRQLVGRSTFVVIDEAQRVRDIGLTLKLIRFVVARSLQHNK